MRTLFQHALCSGVLLVALSGCSALQERQEIHALTGGPSGQDQVTADREKSGGSQGAVPNQQAAGGGSSKETIDLTPMTKFVDQDTGMSAVSFVDSYTRLRISSKVQENTRSGTADTGGFLPYDERNILSRYLMNIKYDISILARIQMGDYEESVSLATLSSSSGTGGQTSQREVAHELSAFPWFLVRKDGIEGTPRITLEFNASRTMDSGMAGSALQLTLATVRALVPTSSVATSLSDKSAKDKAQAIDSAIGKLFSRSLNEKHRSDRDFSRWQPDGGVAVTVFIPQEEGNWNGKIFPAGTWRIGFDEPRPSIFSDWHYCAAERAGLRCKQTLESAQAEVLKEKNAASILSFEILKTGSSKLTVLDHLQQQAWYSTAFNGIGTDASANARILNGLCQNIRRHIEELRLNRLDANLVTWAVMTGTNPPAAVTDALWGTAPDCADVRKKTT